MINFESHSVTTGSSFILIHKHVQFSWHQLLKSLSFSYWLALTPLSKIIWPSVWGFLSGLSVLFHWFLRPLMLVLRSYCCSFLVSFEISKYRSFSFDCSRLFWLLDSPWDSIIDFRMGFTVSVIKNVIGILIKISLHLYFALGSTDTFKRIFWLCWVFVLVPRLFIAVHWLFLAAANRGYSVIVERLLAWASPCRGFSCC